MDPATEPPSPITPSLVYLTLGLSIVNYYLPLTHLVKLLTTSNLTLSKSSFLASPCISEITSSSTLDPHILGPYVSVKYASRLYEAPLYGLCAIFCFR